MLIRRKTSYFAHLKTKPRQKTRKKHNVSSQLNGHFNFTALPARRFCCCRTTAVQQQRQQQQQYRVRSCTVSLSSRHTLLRRLPLAIDFSSAHSTFTCAHTLLLGFKLHHTSDTLDSAGEISLPFRTFISLNITKNFSQIYSPVDVTHLNLLLPRFLKANTSLLLSEAETDRLANFYH
uniref:(northern house mosquito) hypothetical protein n=1 Tax=Culex pipiens TaxID=7175 RepID=A0A8D8PB78_CULPI